MNPNVIIADLRNEIPSISDRVGGAEDINLAESTGKLTPPCLYITKGPDETILESSPQMDTVEFSIEETIYVIIEVKNTSDILSNNAQNQVDAFRDAVLSVINNRYSEDSVAYPLYYNGGDVSQLTGNARYFWEMEFKRQRCQIDYDRESGSDNITPLLKIIYDINLAEASEDSHPNAEGILNLEQ